jgi:transposase, IS5 family
VLDHQIMVGNPPDAPLLAPAIEQVIARTGKVPQAVTADRGYGEAGVDQELARLGVGRVAIPRRGRAGPARQLIERQRGFRRLVKWRTGCEGRISCLKHRFGWDRTRMDGIDAPASGAATACSPTTWSRLPGCWKPSTTTQHDHPKNHAHNPDPPQPEADHPHRQAFFRAK